MSNAKPAKRFKLSKENEFKSNKAESGFHSEIDFSSNLSDFSLPVVKRKSPAPRRASLQQFSLNLTTDNTQQSSGYSSFYSSNNNLTSTASLTSLTRTSRTPKKRKSEISASDENFYNSFQFVSPVKIRKKDINDKNCAKLVLKEKCSSENVILCSTPIRQNAKNTKWGKFRSFHPEKFQIASSLDDAASKVTSTPPIKDKLLAESSFNLSNIDFSNLSGGNFTQDIPTNVQNLWTDDIKDVKKVSLSTSESQVKSVPVTLDSTRHFNDGRKLDIMGALHAKNDIAIEDILGYLEPAALLSLSHVSKNYRHIVKSNKKFETKRLNYLKKHRASKENKLPLAAAEAVESATAEKKKTKAFGNYNLNISKTAKKKTLTPQSPSTRRFHEMQKLIKTKNVSAFKHCPRCRKPAKVSSLKIRNSPRKKKNHSIYKASLNSTGSIQKRTRSTFLSKTSIPESFHETISPQYVTISHIEDGCRSPDRSSGCESPSSDDSCDFDEIYEYGKCTSIGCSYKFCIKCNCKYHPRRVCGDLSPPSPSRINHSKILAGSKASRKSLKRLNY